jgi:PKD repeat protein
MIFGPAGASQALYYTTYANGGQVRRIELAQQPQNHPPTGALTADVTTGIAPLTVHFDGSGSSDPDSGDTLTYIWAFGDGTAPTETTDPTVAHTYAAAGTFTASLTVRDSHGATSAPASVPIAVSGGENHAPIAALTADPTSGPAPLSVAFDAGASTDPDAGDSLTYVWDFGDGTPAAETTTATATHVYTSSGMFTATLAVRDNHGATSALASVAIEAGPALALPQNVVLPGVDGMFRVDNVLTASTGTWTGSEPLEFAYQWLRCNADGNECIPIPEATKPDYELVGADFGSALRLAVTASNGAGSVVAISLPTERIKHECSGDPCTR